MIMYETHADREREAVVMQKIQEAWNFEVCKIDDELQYGLDCVLVKPGSDIIVAFGEIKCRTCASTDFAETRILASKLMHAGWVSRITLHPVLLFIQFTDQLLYMRLSDPVKYTMRRMRVRNDRPEIKAALHIPISDFRKLDERPTA